MLARDRAAAAANRRAGALTLLERKRLELARALATEPRAAAARRDRRRPDRGRVPRWSRPIRGIHARGHHDHLDRARVHALLAVVDRLVVLDFGRRSPRAARGGDGLARRCARSIWASRSCSAAARDPRAHRLLRRLPGAVRRSTFASDEGETVAVIGANGAGKSTFLQSDRRACCRSRRDQIVFDGRPIGGAAGGRHRRRGHRHGAGGAALFPSLTVEENLLIGAYARRAAGRGRWSASTGCFPCSRSAAAAPATALSGGQQQMVAIGRALMSNPRVLLCDEISLGLAPIVIRDIYAALPRIKARAAPRGDRRAGHRPGARGRPTASTASRKAASPWPAARRADPRARSTPPISGRRHDDLARHAGPRRPARRALCLVCGGSRPGVRRDAARQSRPWRPDRAGRVSDARADVRARARPLPGGRCLPLH